MSTIRFLALLAPLLLLLPASGLAQPAPPRLLGPSVETRAPLKQADAATVQTRLVQPDLAALERIARGYVATEVPSRFILDLFDGLELEAEVMAAEIRPGGMTVFARLVDVELGSAVLTVEQGVLVGSVTFPDGRYGIEREAEGRYAVSRKAVQLFPPEREPRAVFAPRVGRDLAAQDLPADSGRLIDVMVLWTPAALMTGSDAAGMQAIAQASVDQANLVYLNSGVAQRLRLVHAQQVNYVERSSGCADPTGGVPGVDAFECALFDLTGTTDGRIDGVHALRDTHGADLVSLLISDPNFCGLAWLPQPPSASTAELGFSVLDASCAVGNHSFVHELGHNMGAHHDPYVLAGGTCPDGREDGAFCFSRGMVNLAQRWRTVMAYRDQCTAAGVSCPRIDFLSNPNLAYAGAPIGDPATSNNAHTLNRTAKSVAAYRTTAAQHPLLRRFTDIALAHPLFGYIEFLAQSGITSGCAPGRFCPDAPLTRAQLAVFLERALRASNWTPPPASGVFSDVAAGDALAPWIEALGDDGITNGCTATQFCPSQPVTRAQVAALLLRARCGSDYVPVAPSSATFADVPVTHPFFRHIEKLDALGITSGCASGPRRYCPDSAVTRGQMAVFLERAHPFLVPSERCAP